MKKNAPIALVVFAFVAACGPDQNFTKTALSDAAPAITATASTTATTPDAAPAPDAPALAADTAPVNTATASVTATTTPTATATNTVATAGDAGPMTIVITINLGPTGTGTGTGTGTVTGSNADAGTVAPDATVYDAPQACLSFEICGNGIDDNCNGVIDEGCEIVRADALPATLDTQLPASPDASPAPDTAPALVADAQAPVDTKPATVCVEGEFDPFRYCVIDLPNGQTRIGNISCKGGTWSNCRDVNPPQNSASCVGYRDGEVDGYSTCTPFAGCSYGYYVCNGTTWQWECKVVIDWYTPASCLPKLDGSASDTLVAVDTHVSADTTPVVTPDAGTADALVTSADAQAPTDAILTSCQVSVNGQITTLVNGQTIDCAVNGASGQQQCVSGMLSTCVIGASATTMGDHAIIDCQLSGTNVGTLTLTGNVIGDLYDSGEINRVCVIGDSVGGWAGNHKLCLDYNPYTSFRYNFAKISLPNIDNRVTFLGYLRTVTDGGVAEGPERWDDNFVLLYAATAGNKCRMKDFDFNKVVFSQ